MKTVAYLSPTSISKFYDNLDDFYCIYLSPHRPDKEPQTPPMSVGSAFDAYLKSFLHAALFGPGTDPRFERDAIFEAQVEPHNRDFARQAGQHCFEVYKKVGAISDLMLELQSCVGTPRFEFEVRGVVDGKREGVQETFGDMVLLGKPDVFYLNSFGAHVILDFKVSGYCSKWGASPMAGYVRLREEGAVQAKTHKDAWPISHRGVTINGAGFLQDYNVDWARQLSIYAWLCGEEVGGDWIAAIDQLPCRPDKFSTGKPNIRVANHRLRVSREHQQQVFDQARHVWEVCHSDHIFRHLSPEESQGRCAMLDEKAAFLRSGDANDQWLAQQGRRTY